VRGAERSGRQDYPFNGLASREYSGLLQTRNSRQASGVPQAPINPKRLFASRGRSEFDAATRNNARCRSSPIAEVPACGKAQGQLSSSGFVFLQARRSGFRCGRVRNQILLFELLLIYFPNHVPCFNYSAPPLIPCAKIAPEENRPRPPFPSRAGDRFPISSPHDVPQNLWFLMFVVSTWLPLQSVPELERLACKRSETY
jgi:hypothetical protein